MDRFPFRQRPGKGHENHPTYDCTDVWDNGRVYAGVIHASWVKVDLLQPPADDKPKRVDIYMPDRVEQVSLRWGQPAGLPVVRAGNVGVVSVDDAPLEVFWELTPGKA